MRNIVILLLAVMAWGCGARHDIRLERADALACTDPAKAIDILDSIDTSGLSEGDRAWLGLLLAKARVKNHEAVGGEPLTEFAAEYYAARGDSLEMQALYYHGVGLADADSASQAIIALREAYDKAVKGGDHFYAAMAARALGEVFNAQMIPDRQLVWAERAKEQFGKAGKPVHAAWMDLDIADALIYFGRYEEAEKALDALDREEYESSKPFRKRALRHRLALYANTDRHEEMTATLDSLRQNGTAIRAYDYYNLAESYIKRGEQERAAEYRDSVARYAKSRSDSLCLYYLDSRLMKSNGNEEALQAMRMLTDEVMQMAEESVRHPETLILADNYSLKADLAAERAEKERERIALVIIVAVLMIVAAIFVMLYMRGRLRIRRLEAARLREDLSRSESRSVALEEQIAAYRHSLEQNERQTEAINREKSSIEEAMRQADQEYADRIAKLESERKQMESRSEDMSGRIAEIEREQQETEEAHIRREQEQRAQIEALTASRDAIEREHRNLRKELDSRMEQMALTLQMEMRQYRDQMKEKMIFMVGQDMGQAETLFRIWNEYHRKPGRNKELMENVSQHIAELTSPASVKKYTDALDLLNGGWLETTVGKLGKDLQPAEIMLMSYLYLKLKPDFIALLMQKSNAKAVNASKGRLRMRLLELAPEKAEEFGEYLGMRKC